MGDCRPVRTLSVEEAALSSNFMQLIKFVSSRTLRNSFFIFLVPRRYHMQWCREGGTTKGQLAYLKNNESPNTHRDT